MHGFLKVSALKQTVLLITFFHELLKYCCTLAKAHIHNGHLHNSDEMCIILAKGNYLNCNSHMMVPIINMLRVKIKEKKANTLKQTNKKTSPVPHTLYFFWKKRNIID